jgi:APA family basic amino acid/polyamine antiporter
MSERPTFASFGIGSRCAQRRNHVTGNLHDYNAPVALSSSASPRSLERRLGPVDAAAVVIANVIGVGIFITPALIAETIPNPLSILGVWVFGGLLAFAGAMAYAELAALRPRSGGEYVYLREAFGPFAAFLTGWTSFVAGFAGAIAAAALTVPLYLGTFVPAANDATPKLSLALGPLSLVFSNQSIVALVAIFGLALIHIRGLGPGRLVQNTLAGLKVGALALFVAIGLGWGHGTMANLASGPASHSTNFALAMLLVMFTYSGWNAASYVAEEIRDPGRNVPIALGLGTGVVVVLYLGINLLYLYALPVDAVLKGAAAGQTPNLNVAALVLLGPSAERLLGALAIVILLSSLSAMTLAGPRVYFAMARDGVFFRSAGRVHPRYHTPWLAILTQAVWSGLLVLTNTRDQLAQYTGFAVLLFSGFAVAALFVLRRRRPDEPRPFRAWGYPLAPALFIIASLGISAMAVAGRPRQAAWGLVVMALGVPLYVWMKWRHPAGDPESREAPRA